GAHVGRPRPVDIKPVQPAAQVHSQEIRLELVDQSGLARPDFVTLELPSDPAARLQRIVAALRKAMQQAGSWPTGLDTPEVFVQQVNRKQVAVLDITESAPVSVGVAEELQLLHSIRQTVLNNGADEVRFLRDGRPAHTLLGHVAVDSAL
ncbi:MAG: GerMN domain-containing protein, partial [Deinococcales bacterium]